MMDVLANINIVEYSTLTQPDPVLELFVFCCNGVVFKKMC
jgi:hypothetical protein